MFIEFAGMFININYIISIYKTKSQDKYFEVNLKLYPNSNAVKEIYSTKEQQQSRFNEIIAEVNK